MTTRKWAPWPDDTLYANLPVFRGYTGWAKMNFPGLAYESYRLTDRQTSYAWSLLVTWQRWRSHHWIRHTRKPHDTRKPDGSIFSRTRIMSDRSLPDGNGNFQLFRSCNVDLDSMTFTYEHDPYSREIGYIGCANNELRTSRLSKVIVCIWHTDRQTDKWCVVTSCHVTKMASHNSVCRSQKPHATRKSDGSVCYRTGVTDDRSYIAGKGILDVFGSCNLDLDPMTFIDELDPYCVEIYRMCKYEFRTSRLSKVIVWQTYVHTYRIDRNYKPRRFEGGQ